VVVLGTANSCFFYWGTGPFVAMTNSDPKVVEVATLVGRMLIPGMFVMWIYTAVRLYVHGLKIVVGTSIAGFGAVFFNIAATGLLVDGSDTLGFEGLGINGAVLSIDLAFAFQLCIACYISFVWSQKFRDIGAWNGWTTASFAPERISTFTKQALPLCAAGVAESWGNRMLTMASGMLGANATASYNIGNVFKGMLSSVFSGFGVAIQVQVAKKLGKGKPDAAKQGFLAVSACIVLLCGLMAAATFVFRHSIATVYSQEDELTNTLIELLPIVCIDFVLSTFASTAKHTLMGMCEADIVVRSQMVSTWVVQLPLSVYLGLYSTWTSGVFGFVWGSVCGNLCSSLLLGYAVFKADWIELSEKAVARSRAPAAAVKVEPAPDEDNQL